MAWSSRPENKSYLIRVWMLFYQFIHCVQQSSVCLHCFTHSTCGCIGMARCGLCLHCRFNLDSQQILKASLNKKHLMMWRVHFSVFSVLPHWLDNKKMIALWKWLCQSGMDTWHSYSFNYRVHYYLQSIFHPSNIMAFHRFWWHFLS